MMKNLTVMTMVVALILSLIAMAQAELQVEELITEEIIVEEIIVEEIITEEIIVEEIYTIDNEEDQIVERSWFENILSVITFWNPDD